MADLPADRLTVLHHDDTVTVYEQVTYCLWRGGVTVYTAGAEVRHDDVVDVQAVRVAVPV